MDIIYSAKDANADVGHVFHVKKAIYYASFTLTKSPTANCQLLSIGSMQNIFGITRDRKEVQNIIREAKDKVSYGDLHLVLLDVKSIYIESVEKCFNVLVKHPYISSNASQMCLFIVSLDALKEA